MAVFAPREVVGVQIRPKEFVKNRILQSILHVLARPAAHANMGCRLLRQNVSASVEYWSPPEDRNPFGVYIRTPDVDEIAARVDDLIIRPGGIPRHREWGLYEVGHADLTGCLSTSAGPPA
jgi:hypothetical protein